MEAGTNLASPANPTAPASSARRRDLRRWTARILSAGLVAGAALYAALPLWLPAGLLAERIEAVLSRDLDRPVHVENLRVGWIDGAVIDGLVIRDVPGAPNPYLLKVRRLRCDLTPLVTLVTGRVAGLEVVGPECWLVRDEAGRLNLERLPAHLPPRLPALVYVVREAVCHVWTPRSRQSFRFDTIDCRLDPKRAVLSLDGWINPVTAQLGTASPPAPRLGFDARLTVPKLRRDRNLSLGGAIRIEWSHLALPDLPLALIPRLPVEQVGGTSSGSLSFQTHPDLTIDFAERIVLNGVRLTWAGLERPALIPDLVLSSEGRYDPNTDLVAIKRLDCRTPSLQVRGSDGGRVAVQIDPRGPAPFDARLEGRIADWARLRQEVPQLGELADRLGLQVSGQARWSLELTRRPADVRAILNLDATASQWAVADSAGLVFDAGPGLPKRLECSANLQSPTGELHAHLLLHCGRTRADAVARVQCGPGLSGRDLALPPVAELLASLAGTLELDVEAVEELLGLVPRARTLPELEPWRGPLHATLDVAPEPRASRVSLRLEAREPAQLGWGDWFRKEPSSALAASAAFTFPHARVGDVSDLRFSCRYEQAEARLVEGPNPLRYALADDDSRLPRLARLDGQALIELTRVDALGRLCPKWEAFLSARQGRAVSGQVSVSARGVLGADPAGNHARADVEIDAGRLALRWGDEFHKPAGEPLTLRLSAASETRNQRREDRLDFLLARPDGRCEGAMVTTGAETSATADDARRLSLGLRVEDVQAWLARSPALARRLGPLRLAGAASVSADADWRPGRLSADVTLEAGDLSVTIPGSAPFEKPAGVPAAFRLHGQADGGPDAGTTILRWSADGARIGGLEISRLNGEWLLNSELPPPRAELEAVVGEIIRRPPAIAAGYIACRGTAVCGGANDVLHPVIAEWAHRLGATGRLTWEAEAGAGAESFQFTGRLDASDLRLRVATGRPAAPIVEKPPGAPARLDLHASTVRHPDGPAQRIVAGAELALDGNRLGVEGELWSPRRPRTQEPVLAHLPFSLPSRADGSSLASADSNWTVELDIQRPDQVLSWLPGTALESLSGRANLQLAVESRRGRFRWSSAWSRFDAWTLGVAGAGLSLDGAVAYEADVLELLDLRWLLGESGGQLAGRVALGAEGHSGSLACAIDNLHVEDLHRRARALSVLADSGFLSVGPAAEGTDRAAALLAFLSRCDLAVTGHVDTFQAALPPGIAVTAHAITHETRIDRGPVRFSFSGAVQGGWVEGRVETRTDSPEPRMHLTYTAQRLLPGPLVDEYLRRSFPGMTATGRVTLIDESLQKLFPAPGEPNHPTGSGELIIEGGYVEGRAAPLAVARIFPGLNLARFDFSYMHSWFTKEPDGRIRHQMIYQGRYYNIYMSGYSEPAGIRYEVGIDFLADFNSRYWAESGQGRIPLFVKTGRLLEDGSLADEEVRYLPPQRILDVLLIKNNPVITAYHAVRKRVRAEK